MGPRLLTIVTDRAYSSHFAGALPACGLCHEVSNCHLLGVLCRWDVERTFAWLKFFCRLVLD
ncbi:hypothetical protein [Hymenobacter sp. AT01-02]|uniref:hypothetical protein n=1 Tax=Hymenobacter sp. AT01-02 TaxID=1571877 RepID=UPI0005F10C9F|nr:hypothetical protein [Hymenobacter sp. AT01-02]